jgi:hypothetical protein
VKAAVKPEARNPNLASPEPKGAVCLGMTTLSEPSSALKPEFATDLGTRYVEELAGQLRCFDRVILHGTLIDVAHPGALLIST